MSPQAIEHKKDHDIWCWKNIGSSLGQEHKCGGMKPV